MLTDAAKRLNAKLTEGETTPKSFSLETGDMGIKISASGDIQIFQYGIDAKNLQEANLASPTPEQRQLMENGELLFALSVVANTPELRDSILNASREAGLIAHEAANGN